MKDKVKCKYCKKQISIKSIKRHIRDIHEDDAPYGRREKTEIPCDKCDRTFKTATAFVKHKQEDHVLECKQCNYRTIHAQKLDFHMKKRHVAAGITNPKSPFFNAENQVAEKVHTCSECKVTFTRKSDLQRHEKNVHKGIRDYFCKICGLGVTQITSLRSHALRAHDINIDESEEKYQQIVSKAREFKTSSQLAKVEEKKIYHYYCAECYFIGMTIDQLVSHYDQVHLRFE